MTELLNQILQTRAGGAVQRCHTIRHHGSYSVAEHSWGVAMLLWHLYPDLAPHLVYYALTHDVPEGLTGDVPSTAKEHQDTTLDDAINHNFGLPMVSALSDHEHHVLKSCDWLDLFIWGKEQFSLGNAFAQEIVSNLSIHFNTGALEKRANEFYVHHLAGQSVVPDRVGLLKSIKDKGTWK